MVKKRLNQDEAFQNLMGVDTGSHQNKAETIPQANDTIITPKLSSQGKETEERNKPTSFYITDKHRKTLKMKTALSDKLEDKDFSSIVRAALDVYLADILKGL